MPYIEILVNWMSVGIDLVPDNLDEPKTPTHPKPCLSSRPPAVEEVQIVCATKLAKLQAPLGAKIM